MRYFVLNVVHGVGPILRLLELGEEVNREIERSGGEPYSFVIPDLATGKMQ